MPRPGHRPRRTALTLGVWAALVVASAAPAVADDGNDGVERRGRCSQGAEWKIRARPEDGRIEVQGEVDSGQAGQTWKWRLYHNESLSAQGTGSTGGLSSYEVSRVMTDLAGTDRFSFRARNTRSGEWCRGPVSF